MWFTLRWTLSGTKAERQSMYCGSAKPLPSHLLRIVIPALHGPVLRQFDRCLNLCQLIPNKHKQIEVHNAAPIKCSIPPRFPKSAKNQCPKLGCLTVSTH
eukprot:6473291-Amphidinium_carterae.1